MLDINTIYLRRKNKVIVDAGQDTASLQSLATLLKNIENLGYTLSNELLEKVSTLPLIGLVEFYSQTIDDLKVMVGDNVEHKPMYPNFPKQVMEMDEAELYFNAMIHYFGSFIGTRLIPHYEVEKREELQDDIKLKVIELGTREDFQTIFTNLVSSNTSISSTDKDDINWFIRVLGDPTGQRDLLSPLMPETIPLRENVALVTGLFIERGLTINDSLAKNIKTATDVLRIAVYLSEGDISLAQVAKFRNFKRYERRLILDALEGCKNITEDMIRYKERWKRLGERLHPFENKVKYSNCCKAFSVIFNKEPYQTFGGKVEASIATFDIERAANLLKTRPGEYARRLDNMIRLSDDPKSIVKIFKGIANKVSTPVLLQVKTHFSKRHESNNDKIRTFFPKGNVARIKVIDNTLQRINPSHCKNIVSICENALKEKFAEEKSLGKVYLDKKLSGFNVPFSQRSASKALRAVPRGSKYDLAEGDTVRFFIHWKDITDGYYGRVDVDLSAIGLDEDHKEVMQISYTNLRGIGGHHSGDITSAPDGASEFIDISIEKCLKKKVRYIMMSVFSFTHQLFTDIPECFAGIMMRQKPNSGEIFDPKTVDNRMDLTADTQICIPMIIDLLERKVIWTDLGLRRNLDCYNNLHANMSSLQVTAKAMTGLNKPDLYDLFRMHAEARGEFVDNIEDADTVFSIEEGITPFDTDVIVSEYLK
jgi:stress response protein SCP2